MDLAGEIIGNSAERLINLIDEASLKKKSLQPLLDLTKVTYINSYSFGIIAYLWKIVKESGRKLHIVANAGINAKFYHLGLAGKAGLKIISPNKSARNVSLYQNNNMRMLALTGE